MTPEEVAKVLFESGCLNMRDLQAKVGAAIREAKADAYDDAVRILEAHDPLDRQGPMMIRARAKVVLG